MYKGEKLSGEVDSNPNS